MGPSQSTWFFGVFSGIGAGRGGGVGLPAFLLWVQVQDIFEMGCRARRGEVGDRDV